MTFISVDVVFSLPSSSAIFCLWLIEELFQTASSTRLPNLEQAILTYWPWENENTLSLTWKQINILDIERF